MNRNNNNTSSQIARRSAQFYQLYPRKLEILEARKKRENCNHPLLEHMCDSIPKIGSDNESIIEYFYGRCLECGRTMIEIDEDYEWDKKKKCYIKNTNYEK